MDEDMFCLRMKYSIIADLSISEIQLFKFFCLNLIRLIDKTQITTPIHSYLL